MRNLQHIRAPQFSRRGISCVQTWTVRTYQNKNRCNSHSLTSRVMHVPFLDRCLCQALSISYLLATSAQTAHAYPQTNLKSPNSNDASLNLSTPSLLPSRFSSLALSYGDLSPDRTSPSMPYSSPFPVPKPQSRNSESKSEMNPLLLLPHPFSKTPRGS